MDFGNDKSPDCDRHLRGNERHMQATRQQIEW